MGYTLHSLELEDHRFPPAVAVEEMTQKTSHPPSHCSLSCSPLQ